ncbi:ATPase [Leeuwenhoekiella sp. H156]|uniref:ATPase n=1 Tax=Leeuwenhoekiella sp. H156 TaxID=3450128 RepID=UPI003FA4221B
MGKENLQIIKSSGEKVHFSLPKLKASLRRSGADEATVNTIIDKVRDEWYQDITTNEIYNRAYALLKKSKPIYASKYKLKKAIFELGPTGFPFERFISALLKYSGYETLVGQIVQGNCVEHEVDVIAKMNDEYIIAECKFRSDSSNVCNVKVPLYIHSRYKDIVDHFSNQDEAPNQGWVVTNTRFTKDALEYGRCAGLYMLSWSYPRDNGIKDRIDRLGLYPLTVSTLLTAREKQFLLSRDVVLCRQLLSNTFFLDHLGVSNSRKTKILNEIKMLCQPIQ